jgi:hypothetical protein
MRMVVHAARNAPVIAAAGDEGKVQIWNFDTGERLSEFVTVCDDGSRLALSATGETLIAANWRKGKRAGVACYETGSGKPIWHRPDLRQVQHMKFSAQGDWVWCQIDSRPVHCLDARTGSTVKIWRTIQDVLDSPFSPHILLLRRTDFVIRSQTKSVSVPRLSRSGLEAAFGPDTVCVCEFSNPTVLPVITVQGIVRCLEFGSGGEHWRYQPPDGHWMQLISYQDDQYFYGVQSGYEQGRRNVALIRLSSDEGLCAELCRLSPPPYFGGFGAGVLVTPEGEVVSLQTGEIIRRLPFSA